jgi:dTDP-glucose pyrophosphorylase
MGTTEIQPHLIYKEQNVYDALIKLNALKADSILFVVDENNKLLGSLTDGDLRRGFIKGFTFETPILDFVQPNPLKVYIDELHLVDMDELRKKFLLIIPVVDRAGKILRIINLRTSYSMIPADVFIMAGGKGERLMPLTKDTPKPMLPVGDRPMLEHTINHLKKFGIKNIHFCVNYLKHVIMDHFKDGSDRDLTVKYVIEDKPLGTLGALKLADEIEHDYILLMNSDILTNIDLNGFFKTFIKSGADMAVAASSYHVDVPYGILEVDGDNRVNALKEKPRYTYYSNAGIYLIKKELLQLVPENKFYNVTDLMDKLISNNKKLVSYPILGYWLDIGKHDDYRKAQEDIKFFSL